MLPKFIVLETLKAILPARSCIPHGNPKRNTAAVAGVWHPAVVSATPAQRDQTQSVFISRIKKKKTVLFVKLFRVFLISAARLFVCVVLLHTSFIRRS